MRLGIVSSISQHMVETTTWRTWLATHRWHIHNQRQEAVDVGGVGRTEDHGHGNPLAIGQDMELAPRFAAIRGVWAGFRTAQRCLGRTAVNNAQAPIETVSVVKLTQQPGVELFPDFRFLEFWK